MYIEIILWLLILVLISILLKLLDVQKNYIFCLFITFFIFVFIFNLQTSILGALEGAKLVYKSILPTIFPFAVICNLLIRYDGITLYSKLLGPIICKPLKLPKSCSFPIAASILSGYPLGAKYSSELYNMGSISKSQYERLLNIASNGSPIFILGAVASTMLHNPNLGYILLIGNYISPLIVGILTIKNSKYTKKEVVNKTDFNNINFGTALKESIENGMQTFLQVSAYVIIFSIIMAIIKENAYISIFLKNIESIFSLPKSSLYGLFIGSIEFTNGCKLISESSLSLTLQLSIISFICSFSGLSIIGQVTSFVGKDNINLKKYTLYKLLQGIFSFVITFTISTLMLNTQSVFSSEIIYMNININLYVFFALILFTLPLFYLIPKSMKRRIT